MARATWPKQGGQGTLASPRSPKHARHSALCTRGGPSDVLRTRWPGCGGPGAVARERWPGSGGLSAVARERWPQRGGLGAGGLNAPGHRTDPPTRSHRSGGERQCPRDPEHSHSARPEQPRRGRLQASSSMKQYGCLCLCTAASPQMASSAPSAFSTPPARRETCFLPLPLYRGFYTRLRAPFPRGVNKS